MSKSEVVVLKRNLINSSAFMELPSTAVKVLLWFLARRKYARLGKSRRNSIHINNGEIVFPYAEAGKRFAMTRPRFTKSIDHLIQFGFIDINHHGGGMVKDVTTYFISERWEKYGQPDFEQRKRTKDTRGLGFTAKNWEERSGKKRRSKSKPSNENVTTVSNKNVTALDAFPCASGNKNVTEEIDPNFFIYKGEELIRYFQQPSNENVTIL